MKLVRRVHIYDRKSCAWVWKWVMGATIPAFTGIGVCAGVALWPGHAPAPDRTSPPMARGYECCLPYTTVVNTPEPSGLLEFGVSLMALTCVRRSKREYARRKS